MKKSIKTLDLGVNTHSKEPLMLSVIDTSHIDNVVKKIENSGTISGVEIDMIYISEHRVCIQLKNKVEFSIPVKGTELF